MKHFEEIDENNYSSEVIDDLLAMITPESQALIDHKMKLAAIIYDALRDKGWKNQDLAKALNLKSPSLVSKWLSGTHNFTVDTLVLIGRALNIQLLNIKLNDDGPNPSVYKDFTVGAIPVSLHEDAFAPLQTLTDDSGKKSNL
jgi:transcriptional regulator with XRE-family HTH domain